MSIDVAKPCSLCREDCGGGNEARERIVDAYIRLPGGTEKLEAADQAYKAFANQIEVLAQSIDREKVGSAKRNALIEEENHLTEAYYKKSFAHEAEMKKVVTSWWKLGEAYREVPGGADKFQAFDAELEAFRDEMQALFEAVDKEKIGSLKRNALICQERQLHTSYMDRHIAFEAEMKEVVAGDRWPPAAP